MEAEKIMKPLSSCALFGATRALRGIRAAVLVQHSVIGCQWGSLVFGYADKSYAINQASTVVYEDEVINGGEKQLIKALGQVKNLFPQQEAVFIVSGCVPNLIGDDVQGAVLQSGIPNAVHVAAPGYRGNIDTGVENAYLALYDLIQEPVKKEKSINIFGIMYDDAFADNDIKALEKIFNKKVRINCTLHRCTMQDIEHLAEATLNVCFGYGISLAKKMQEKYNIPYIECDYPYGISGSKEFLKILAEKLQIDFSEEITCLEQQAKSLAYRSSDYLPTLYQAPVALIADKAHLQGLVKFFTEEVGMRVMIAKDTARYNLNDLEKDIIDYAPVLLCGSSWLNDLAAKYTLPLLRVAYPTFDRVCFTDKTYIGAYGAAHIIEDIINITLQLRYKEQGVYSDLNMECADV